jgi:hypothetical protein
MKTMKAYSSILFVLLLFGASRFVTACDVIPGVRGNGDVLKETRQVPSFNGLEISGAFKVIIKQGATEEVVIEADANILPLIKTEVVGGELKIYTNKPIHNPTVMKAYITVKELKDIDVSGAVDIESEGRLNLQELSIDASGASDSKLDLQVQKLTLDCSGASKMKFAGSANIFEMELSGASDIFAFDLVSESCDIEISGAGNAQINVSKRLSAEVSGAGTIRYKGSPTEIDQEVSGAGSIKKAQ